METNVKEELVRRCGLDVAGSGLRPVADLHENGQWSSDGIQVGELLECLSHNQLSKKESGRNYVVTYFNSSSVFQIVSVRQRVCVCVFPYVILSPFPLKPNKSREEYCALLGHYAASSGNFLRTFWDNLLVPLLGGWGARIKIIRNCLYSLRKSKKRLDLSFFAAGS